MKIRIKTMLLQLALWAVAGVLVSSGADTGTVVQTADKSGPVRADTFTWTSGTNNNSVTAVGQLYIRGSVERVTFVPSTTAAPTGTYTAVVKDAAGVDILAGLGASLSASTASTVIPGLPISNGVTTNIRPFAVSDILNIAVTNCGNSKSGQIIILSR